MITSIRLGLAYLLDLALEFLMKHFEFLHSACHFIFGREIAQLLPDGPYASMPLSIETLLGIGFFLKLLNIVASPGNLRRVLLFSILAPWILTYMAQVFKATKFPEHHIEFAIMPGVLFGLTFMFFVEYQIILQARRFDDDQPE